MDALADAHSGLERIVCEKPIEDSWQLVREFLQRVPDTELGQYAVALLELFVSARREGAIALRRRHDRGTESTIMMVPMR